MKFLVSVVAAVFLATSSTLAQSPDFQKALKETPELFISTEQMENGTAPSFILLGKYKATIKPAEGKKPPCVVYLPSVIQSGEEFIMNWQAKQREERVQKGDPAEEVELFKPDYIIVEYKAYPVAATADKAAYVNCEGSGTGCRFVIWMN